MAMRTSFSRKLVFLGLFSLVISVSIGLSLVSAGPKFTSDKWGEQVGFKPDFSKGAVAAGKKIKKGKYRGMEGYIAPGSETAHRQIQPDHEGQRLQTDPFLPKDISRQRTNTTANPS